MQNAAGSDLPEAMMAVLASEVKLAAACPCRMILASMPSPHVHAATTHGQMAIQSLYMMQEHARLSKVCKEVQLLGMFKRK